MIAISTERIGKFDEHTLVIEIVRSGCLLDSFSGINHPHLPFMHDANPIRQGLGLFKVMGG